MCIISYCSLSHCTAAPVIDESSPPNITADVGATITFTCVSWGSPPDTFTWRKDNDPLMLPSTSITALEHTGINAIFKANYIIDSVDLNNNGTYTCTVANPIGSDSANITIITIGMHVC